LNGQDRPDAFIDASQLGEPEVMSSIDRQVYTPEEVAQILGMHPNSVYALLKEGSLPGIKAGRRWLISKKRLDAWLD
jgi:excisionase family DNA binding protein